VRNRHYQVDLVHHLGSRLENLQGQRATRPPAVRTDVVAHHLRLDVGEIDELERTRARVLLNQDSFVDLQAAIDEESCTVWHILLD